MLKAQTILSWRLTDMWFDWSLITCLASTFNLKTQIGDLATAGAAQQSDSCPSCDLWIVDILNSWEF